MKCIPNRRTYGESVHTSAAHLLVDICYEILRKTTKKANRPTPHIQPPFVRVVYVPA